MVSKRHYQAYNAAMQTMANTTQVVVLYDGVIRYLQQAREAMREHRVEERFHNLTRAGEIVFGLQGCLDFERGGEIAKVLYNFYASVDARIFALHRSNDVAVCEQVIADMRQMREVWDEIDRSTSGGDASVSPHPEPLDGAPNAPTTPPADAAGNVAISA